MSDIWMAAGVMAAGSIGLGMLAATVCYPANGQGVVACLTVATAAMCLFQFYGAGQLFWARWVPHSAAIVYTNFAALLAALAAGWAWRLPGTPRWRRGGLSIMLSVASLVAIHWPMLSVTLRPPPVGADVWDSGVARQTSWATCSPAAAATLLWANGIVTSEQELIPLCLTDSSGTPTLGLYRGVKLMAARHGRSVRIVDGDVERLLADDSWPVLLAVKLPFGIKDQRYSGQWGWLPGMGHSVVVLGRTPAGNLLIGDPAVGLEEWTAADLKILWQGKGLQVQ